MEIWYNYETAIKIRHCDKIWRSAVHIIAHNFFRQFLNVTFNEIFCLLVLFLFYGTIAKYIASGNSWWLLWPKCWLETEFDYRLRLRFSLLIQLILGKCESCFDAVTSMNTVNSDFNCCRHCRWIYLNEEQSTLA